MVKKAQLTRPSEKLYDALLDTARLKRNVKELIEHLGEDVTLSEALENLAEMETHSEQLWRDARAKEDIDYELHL